jgi:hypothetical protein
MSTNQIAQRYVAFLTYFGQTELHDYDVRSKTLFAPYVKKTVNGQLTANDRDQLMKKLHDAKKSYGIEQVQLLEITKTADESQQIARFEIIWGKNHGTEKITATLTSNDDGLIDNIDEVVENR